MKLYTLRTVPLSIIRSFSLYTQQWFMSCRFCWHIPLFCVQWKTPDDGQRNCPKHVEFIPKINLEISTPLKVKWPRYRPGVAQRVDRSIALLFHDRSTRRWWVVSSTPRPHLPGTHCTGGWVGPRAAMDWRKISSPPGFDPGPFNP